MNELKFNSQICTSIEQSQRLLDLGLKPETADMNWTIVDVDREGNNYSVEYISIGRGKYQLLHPNWYIPAWSLHRLMWILEAPLVEFYLLSYNPYEEIIYNISECIKNGYINKEYLKQ